MRCSTSCDCFQSNGRLKGKNYPRITVRRAVLGLLVWDEDTKQFSHATGLMIISRDGLISEYLDGVNFSPNDLSSAIERGKNNELTVRETISFVRFYLYDPTTGKFGAVVQWTIRGLVLATVLLIGLGIVRMNRLSRTDRFSTEKRADAEAVIAYLKSLKR